MTVVVGRFDDGNSEVPGGVKGPVRRVLGVGAGIVWLTVANARSRRGAGSGRPAEVGGRHRPVRQVACALVLALGASAGAACGAIGPGVGGTDRVGPVENAANVAVGPVRVRDAYATISAPGRLAVRFSVVNDGPAADRLLDVAATGSRGQPRPPGLPLALPPGVLVDLDHSGVDISALGLEPAPLAGSALAVTFSFAMAGSVSAWLPVVSRVP